jgi:hypothetical protein
MRCKGIRVRFASVAGELFCGSCGRRLAIRGTRYIHQHSPTEVQR